MSRSDVGMNDRSKEVSIIYTNWQGKTATRRVRPLEMWFGSTQWHPESQWLLKAIDLDKQAERDFALKDIQGWESESE